MNKLIIIRYSEIFLKSPPVLKRLEGLLVKNIKRILKGKDYRLEKSRGRIFIFTEKPENLGKKLKYVFGIYSWSPAVVLPTTNPEEIKKFVSKEFGEKIKKEESFALRVRVAKPEKYSSFKIAEIVGEGIKRKVNLTSPDKEIFLELREGKTYIFDQVFKGNGGLPVGSSGRVLSLISGGIDSPVASWLMMKRGCRVVFLHFHSFPLVSKKSYEKTLQLARVLNKYQGKTKIYFIPFGEIQSWLKTHIENKYLVIFYRRLMFKIAQEVAKNEGIKALVTGESLGQVASQTLDNLAVISQGIKIPVFRPLIGWDKEEIVNLAKKIKTYNISIEPQEDCCSLFIPRHPATKANWEKIKSEEEKVPQKEFIKKACKEAEIIVLK
ncbi:MAG: tRNA uracil 4-sulfurtransferase ThiI [Microgenomates group bacterium]